MNPEPICTRCLSLVGLPGITILDVQDVANAPLRVHIELTKRTVGCESCGVVAHVKDRPVVELVDLSIGRRPTRLVWHKRRFRCPEPSCATGTWTEDEPTIAPRGHSTSDRVGRWVTEQVGRNARSVSDVARDLACDWHTVNKAVVAYGTALVDDDPDRFGEVTALGLDEVAFARLAPWRRVQFSTSIVDVRRGQLLDVVPGRRAEEPIRWIEAQGQQWRDKVAFATLDLSGPFRSVFDATVPNATQVADPFHVVKLATQKMDECRRRVQNEIFGHRGIKDDPLWKARRLMTIADERLSEEGRTKRTGLLKAGDPRGEVAIAFHAKEAVRELYAHHDPELALQFVEALADDMDDREQPLEVRSLGRTLKRWKHQIAAWHLSHVSNGPTEAANNLIKRVKRAAFGFTSFRNYRIRALLYAGKPNWDLLETITPR